MLSRQILWINPHNIKILPSRQRSGEIDLTDILPSIEKRGVMNPVILNDQNELIAGERRTRAAIRLGLAEIPYRFGENLTPRECKIIELEENERRRDLPWRDQVRAIAELHIMYSEDSARQGEKWSVQQTADTLFYSAGHIFHVLRVHRDLASPRIAQVPSLKAAYNVLARLDERKIGDAMSSIAEAGATVQQAKAPAQGQAPVGGETTGGVHFTAHNQLPPAPPKPFIKSELESIQNQSFIEWLKLYNGPRFNLVHCDFPYGIEAFAGPQSGRNSHETYDDSANVYWELIREFCENLDKFMAESAHLVFWLSADYDIIEETISQFGKLAPELRFGSKPLIWHKSDNVGILSDPKRGPRHVYETALIASRGDRYILQAVSDCYPCPTDKRFHPSTKPESMLRHYFRMFVDEHTSLLDPTCGSGAALRAAESLGAKHVLGLELSPEHCSAAQSALKQFRVAAAMSRKAQESKT